MAERVEMGVSQAVAGDLDTVAVPFLILFGGADFMLIGQINTIIDADSNEQVRFYQVDLTLVSMKDNRKVWLGQKKIKKFVKNSKLRY